MSKSQLLLFLVALMLLPAAARSVAAQAAFSPLVLEKARATMVEEVVMAGGVKNQRVLDAMRKTPRHEFMDIQFKDKAYFDMALPIGHKQTISSPFIVAYMTEAIDPQPTEKVLEIGTGSGYQAAVLSPLAKEVYSIEIVPELGQKAARVLKRLKYDNVHTMVGDGYKGWPMHAPFDKIIVTCSPEKVPQPLIDQLRDGGRMIVPVGERYQQVLYLFSKKEGKLVAEKLIPTLFVPMTGVAEDNRQVKPDPLNPALLNPGFEEPAEQGKALPGWYYTQQWSWETSKNAPQGEHYLQFKNDDAGRASNALQGFAIDGRKIGEVNVTAMVKADKIAPSGDDLPAIIISFFDENRRELTRHGMGPFRGSFDWKKEKLEIKVPPQAREGVVRLGLWGATGEFAVDNITFEPVKR